MSGLRKTHLPRALHRPSLILGGERELVLFTGLVAGGLSFSALNLPAVVVSVCVWSGCLYALRMMAKADPVMSKIYTRQLKYRDYFPPRSRPFRNL